MKITADADILVRAVFLSFDRKAVKLMEAQGESVRLLS